MMEGDRDRLDGQCVTCGRWRRLSNECRKLINTLLILNESEVDGTNPDQRQCGICFDDSFNV